MAKLTIEEMRKQKNRNKTKKTKKQKKQTESNSTPKSRKGAKKDQDKPKKLAQLKEVFPGIAGNDSTLKLLKRLQINPKDLTDGKYKYEGKA